MGQIPWIYSRTHSFAVHPHVRGADWYIKHSSGCVWRFIPTCVGQMHAVTFMHSHLPPVHPHVRGADPSKRRKEYCSSSVHPHVRGADANLSRSIFSAPRFIPTCVGQMLRDRPPDRIRFRFIPTCVGQMRTFATLMAYAGGSSPRAWGRCSLIWYRRCCCRFIPTCVGQISS